MVAVGADGIIISINIEDGRNTRHFKLKDYDRSVDQGLFYFSDKYLYNVYSIDHKSCLRIYKFEKSKLIKEKKLPTMDSVLSKHQYPTLWWWQMRKNYLTYKQIYFMINLLDGVKHDEGVKKIAPMP